MQLFLITLNRKRLAGTGWNERVDMKEQNRYHCNLYLWLAQFTSIYAGKVGVYFNKLKLIKSSSSQELVIVYT